MTQAVPSRPWYVPDGVATIDSPALLIYRERLEANLRRMLEIAGDPARLRPHIKTHKMREVLKLQLALGIGKFKCATIAEAEMAADAGVKDLLLAYQPVGPAIARVAQLIQQFPDTQFSVICDDPEAIRGLSVILSKRNSSRSCGGATNHQLEVLLDLDVGQHRTGVAAGPQATELYRLINTLPGLKPGGLHAYDGHISDSDPRARSEASNLAFEPVTRLKTELLGDGLAVPRVVAGGTPTFPIHARREQVECSPGTCVFWDAGYATKLPDLGFQVAALLLCRVISKPAPNRLCLDLGHKAVASEMPHPRVQFIGLEDAKAVVHSEEHLVIETPQAPHFRLGDCLFGIPWHICPTVALHSAAVVIEGRQPTGSWRVAARDRHLTI